MLLMIFVKTEWWYRVVEVAEEFFVSLLFHAEFILGVSCCHSDRDFVFHQVIYKFLYSYKDAQFLCVVPFPCTVYQLLRKEDVSNGSDEPGAFLRTKCFFFLIFLSFFCVFEYSSV